MADKQHKNDELALILGSFLRNPDFCTAKNRPLATENSIVGPLGQKILCDFLRYLIKGKVEQAWQAVKGEPVHLFYEEDAQEARRTGQKNPWTRRSPDLTSYRFNVLLL